MRALRAALAASIASVAIASPALAHVTIQPTEAIAGSFSRFVVRVPNERPDSSTIKVQVQLPPLAFVSFEPKDGWKRVEKTGEFPEPIEAFGEELTEGVLSVTWSGGEIASGEFDEFGFSAKMPDGEEQLVFKAIQTYDNGEVVRWVNAPDAEEEPAGSVTTYDLGLSEGQGQIAALAAVQDSLSNMDHGAAAAPTDDDDDDESGDTLALGLGAGGLALGLIALLVALRKRA